MKKRTWRWLSAEGGGWRKRARKKDGQGKKLSRSRGVKRGGAGELYISSDRRKRGELQREGPLSLKKRKKKDIFSREKRCSGKERDWGE